jgi:L-threonylcarbamoyladenylate synthase
MPSAQVLPTHTPQLFQAAVQQAAKLLRQGQLVVLPTETVYGLAANALDRGAVSQIFAVKGRPSSNPIIVHVASLDMARRCAREWPLMAGKLAAAFWPGPLTMVLPRAQQIPDIVTAGGSTVGVRWPSHPFIQSVIQMCGFPLAAPSANISNRLSPTNATHVREQLGDKVPLIVDGGQSQVGIESTVIDLSVSPPRVLRPGMIHDEALLAVTGELSLGSDQTNHVLKSPGQLPRHYAPKAELVVLSWANDAELQQVLTRHKTRNTGRDSAITPHGSVRTHVIAHTHIPSSSGLAGVSVIPHDAEAFARALYGELHRCDQAGADLIVVEAVPRTSEWRGISDRLKRAAPKNEE